MSAQIILSMMDRFKELEKIIKGGANHWRLKILFLLDREPDLSLSKMTDRLEAHFKTVAQHSATLHRYGLIDKRYHSRTVLHTLSSLGNRFLALIKKI